MSLLCDTQIIEECARGMITPYVDRQVKEENGVKIVSYGVSSYGYDIRLDDKFISCHSDTEISPHQCESLVINEINDTSLLILPRTTILGKSVERFNIPNNLMVTATGKSTYARLSILVNITPLEPNWKGVLTISISNLSSTPVRVYAFQGIAQLLFNRVDKLCTTSYSDRDGKYQNATGIETGKV